jgi:hypothetical protein
MNGRGFLAAAAAAAVLLAALPAPPFARAAGETASCTECGMTAKVEGRYTARIGEGKSALFFCDIGDLVAYIRRTKPKTVPAFQVHDFPSGAWTDGAKARYVRDKSRYQTPMGWGIAAFTDATLAAQAGATMDFDALLAADLKP